jgi:hypothetical protein
LRQAQEKLQEATQYQNMKHDRALEDLRCATEKRLEDADAALLRIPAQLQAARSIAEGKREDFEQLCKDSEDEHKERMRKMKQDHEKQLQDLTSQGRQRINEKEISNERSLTSLEELRESHQTMVAQCQAELLSLYELVLKFTKLAVDIDDGKHPVVWRGGLKEVVLSEGARPILPNLDSFPHLSDAMAKEDEDKSSSRERVTQRSLSSGRWRRAGAGGIAAVAAAEAIRKGSEGTALDDGADDPVVLDDASILRRVCIAEADAEAEKLLGRLSVAQLRCLCVGLRAHSMQNFAPAEERETLRRIAVSALEDGTTDHYIRDLEHRRSVEQAALNDVVERGLQLRSCLSSRKGSNASRSLSRPLTPVAGRSRPGSRSGSRPATATGSRPPPQPAYGYPPAAMH